MNRSRRSIEALYHDGTFMRALSTRKIRLSRVARQDTDYYYYDFTDPGGKRIGSFAVQKKVGTIYLMDSRDVAISALKTLSVSSLGFSKKKRTLNNVLSPSQAAARLPGSESRSLDFLLSGAHQGETDTIVVVHADRATGRIVFISVPRDLYYKGLGPGRIPTITTMISPTQVENGSVPLRSRRRWVRSTSWIAGT